MGETALKACVLLSSGGPEGAQHFYNNLSHEGENCTLPPHPLCRTAAAPVHPCVCSSIQTGPKCGHTVCREEKNINHPHIYLSERQMR